MLQPAAKVRKVNPEENKVEKQSVVSLSKQPAHTNPNKSHTNKSLLDNSTCKDENKAKSTGIDPKLRSKVNMDKVTIPLQRYPLRKNGHVLYESKPVLHCKNNVLSQKKQPVIIIKKCHELQRLYNVSFSCKEKTSDTYYLRNGWKQEFHPR